MPATLDDYFNAFEHWCQTQDPTTLRAMGGGMPWYYGDPAFRIDETLAHIAVHVAAGLDCEAAVAAGVASLAASFPNQKD